MSAPTAHQLSSMFFDRSGKPVEKPVDRAVLPRRSVYGIALRDGRVLLGRPTWKQSLDIPGHARAR